MSRGGRYEKGPIERQDRLAVVFSALGVERVKYFVIPDHSLVRQRLGREDGFSILSVLIAMALSLVLFAALGQFNVMTAKLDKKSSDRINLSVLQDSLLLAMRRSDQCSCNFQGLTFPESSASTEQLDLTNLSVFDVSGGGCTPTISLASTSIPVSGVLSSRIYLDKLSKVTDDFYFAKLKVEVGSPVQKSKEMLIGLDTVTSAGSVSVSGCSSGETKVKVVSGMINNGGGIPVPAGFQKSDCEVSLTLASASVWGNVNFVKGINVYPIASTWQAECRVWGNSAIPVPGTCRYTVICQK